METRLVAYQTLTALQQQQLNALEVHPEQLGFSGDIYCALNTLLVNPNPGVAGFALLADEIPVAFLLLKRPPCLPHWADEHSATLHALQVDRHQQGLGFGKACLQALPPPRAWFGRRSRHWSCRWTRIMWRRWGCICSRAGWTAGRRIRGGLGMSAGWRGCFKQ